MTSSTAAAVAVAEPSKLKLSIKALGRDGIASILHLAQIRRQFERVDMALEFDGAHAGAGAGKAYWCCSADQGARSRPKNCEGTRVYTSI